MTRAATTRSGPPATDRRSNRQRIWVPALIALSLAFLAYSVPPYLGDPARAPLPPREGYPPYYPLLVAHIVFGSVALVTGCLQVWPWFRRRFPAAHRWIGRVYLFGGAFPAGIAVLGVAPASSTGFVSSVGNSLLAVLWLVASFAGYRAARRRRYAEHRVWMVRGFALTTSIVLNRVWLVLLLVGLGPFQDDVFGGDERALIDAAAGASVWLSWVVNLLVAEWWLLRTRRPAPRPGPRRAPPAERARARAQDNRAARASR